MNKILTSIYLSIEAKSELFELATEDKISQGNIVEALIHMEYQTRQQPTKQKESV